ncbi:MAG: hypothetical protein ABI700_00930 [Chloroflexota bacterium]
MPRIFKIGLTTIEDDETTLHLTPEEIKTRLSTPYPEIKNSTVKETTTGETTLFEYLPQAGKKG